MGSAHRRVVAAEHRQRLKRGGDARQPQRLGHEWRGEREYVVHDQVRAGCRHAQVVAALPQVGEDQLLDNDLASAPGIHGLAQQARGVDPVVAVRSHRSELQGQGFDTRTVDTVRGHDGLVAATLQLERDGEVGVQVAERAERIEDDARHDLYFTSERRIVTCTQRAGRRYHRRMIHPAWWSVPLVLLLQPSLARAAEPLTVRECVRRARERAPEVRIARATSLAARQDSVGHSFDQRPSFSVFGGATVAPEGYYDPTLTDLGSYELKVGMDWPLRDAGVRAHGRRAAELDARAAIADQRLATRDAGLRAGELALASVRLTEQERAQRDALDWLERLAAELASGARAGIRGRADAHRATLERDDA